MTPETPPPADRADFLRGLPDAAPPQPPPEPAPAELAPGPMAELFELDTTTDSTEIQDIVNRHVQWIVAQHRMPNEHSLLFLFPSGSISRPDADRIYSGVSRLDPDRPLLLVANSGGGDVASAYFISKLCRQYTKATFKVAVARQAKSAATLICCGADQIHMGSLSELGTIDPQFGQIPALALKYSIEHLAQLAARNPRARKMFTEYLSKSLSIEALGYYERVAESAKQYAERLLRSRKEVVQTEKEIEAIAQRLVYTYKDHSFVIDVAEALDIFGGDVVRFDSEEYALANALYPAIVFMEWFIGMSFNRTMSFVGAEGACWLIEDKRSTAS